MINPTPARHHGIERAPTIPAPLSFLLAVLAAIGMGFLCGAFAFGVWLPFKLATVFFGW
jgi:hypothetical protein